jgi:hypothetical protein
VIIGHGDDLSRPRKQRHGTCHRCAWSGHVSKLGRSDRKRLDIARRYGRLCPNCAADLVRQQATTKSGQAKLKAVRPRDVA